MNMHMVVVDSLYCLFALSLHHIEIKGRNQSRHQGWKKPDF